MTRPEVEGEGIRQKEYNHEGLSRMWPFPVKPGEALQKGWKEREARQEQLLQTPGQGWKVRGRGMSLGAAFRSPT